jgi:hypothetical protein
MKPKHTTFYEINNVSKNPSNATARCTYLESYHKGQSIRVDRKVYIADICHGHCGYGGEAHIDETISEEPAELSAFEQSSALITETHRDVQ